VIGSLAREAQRPQLLVDLIQNPPPRQAAWLEPALITKGGTVLLAAEAKAGKSFMLIELARALATGTPAFDSPLFKVTEKCRVLYIEQELGPQQLADRTTRLWTAGHEIGGIYYISKEPLLQLNSNEGKALLLSWIDEVKPGVVILDPLGKMHSYRENDFEDINKLFNFFDEVKYKYRALGLSLVISHHFGKPSKDREETLGDLNPYSMRGSSKFKDDPDSLIMMRRYGPSIKVHDGVLRDGGLDYYKWWKIKCGFTLRHGAEPEDCYMHVNELDDRRVVFNHWESEHDSKKGGPKRPGFRI
jgi:hypothetical protein